MAKPVDSKSMTAGSNPARPANDLYVCGRCNKKIKWWQDYYWHHHPVNLKACRIHERCVGS